MPTHLGHEAITAKLGHADPSMYLGHEQIYPNNVSINSFAFTDTSTVAVTGATRVSVSYTHLTLPTKRIV